MQLRHEDVAPGDGLTERIRDAANTALHAIVPPLFKAQQPWAVMGSTASVLQGIPRYVPPDIDIVTTMVGAYIMEGAISSLGSTFRPVSHSVGGPYTSYFGIFEVRGVKIEIMGDLIIQCEDGSIDTRDHWSRWSDKVRVLHFDDLHIPVVPLEWQLVANTLLGRPTRVDDISSYLLEHGFDRPYLDALLADEGYGARTIAGVREALRLDD